METEENVNISSSEILAVPSLYCSAVCCYNKCIPEQIVLKYHPVAMWYFVLPSTFIV